MLAYEKNLCPCQNGRKRTGSYTQTASVCSLNTDFIDWVGKLTQICPPHPVVQHRSPSGHLFWGQTTMHTGECLIWRQNHIIATYLQLLLNGSYLSTRWKVFCKYGRSEESDNNDEGFHIGQDVYRKYGWRFRVPGPMGERAYIYTYVCVRVNVCIVRCNAYSAKILRWPTVEASQKTHCRLERGIFSPVIYAYEHVCVIILYQLFVSRSAPTFVLGSRQYMWLVSTSLSLSRSRQPRMLTRRSEQRCDASLQWHCRSLNTSCRKLMFSRLVLFMIGRVRLRNSHV